MEIKSQMRSFHEIKLEMKRELEELKLPLLSPDARSEDPLNSQAYVGVSEDWVYAEGYRRAGDLIVEYLETKTGATDFLVYPGVFVYRHCVELMLKQITWTIYEYSDLKPDERSRETLRSHDLAALWELTVHALRVFGYSERRIARLGDLGKRIAELHRHDPGSYAWRYSTNRNRTETSLPNLRNINLSQMKRGMKAIWIVLEAIDTEVEETWRQRMDNAADNAYYNRP